MTMFEYIAVANSLILTLAVVRLIDALPSAFAADRRYWTHAIFVVDMVFASAHYWWVGWRFAAVSAWSQIDFLLFLLPPALLYAISRTLASPDPAAITSFRDYFLGIRRRFFALSAAYQIALALSGWITLGIPLTHPFRVFQAIMIAATLSGIFTTNPPYLAFLAGTSFVAFAVAFVLIPQASVPG